MLVKTSAVVTALVLGASVIASPIFISPASAQKAKDTLRAAFTQPINLVDNYYGSGGEANAAIRMAFDGFVEYDNIKKEYVPSIAESWTQIDPATMEFKIRRDVVFTDGTPLTMDDILYTFAFMVDPNAKYRFQDTRSNWLDRVEKIDDWTIRIHAKEPMAVMLGKLSQVPTVLPKHIHEKLEKKEFFGKAPVGTGPYRIVSVDDANGVVMTRNPDYKLASAGKPAGTIGTIRINPVPDMQTQTARMLRGEQDMMYGVDRDVADSFAGNPDFTAVAEDSVNFNFLQFDAKGISGNKMFMDKRLRVALAHAINRDEITKMLPPEIAKLPRLETVCSPLIKYCDSTVPLPAYDPALAKKLLAEAGYPDGFDLQLLTWGQGKDAAEAVAGMLRKVGVRASVENEAFGVFAKKRIDGVPALVTLWDNSVGQPDINNTAEYYFLTNVRSYTGDDTLNQMALDGRKELDPAKRAEIYKAMFNRSNEEAYVIPLKRIPAIIVHTKELKLLPGVKDPEGFEFNRIVWN